VYLHTWQGHIFANQINALIVSKTLEELVDESIL